MTSDELRSLLAGNLIPLGHEWVRDGEFGTFSCECLLSTRYPYNALCPNKVVRALRAVAEMGPAVLAVKA